MQPLGWPGIDAAITNRVFRLLRPVWALGIRPRALARVLVTVALAIQIFFGVVVGLWGGLTLVVAVYFLYAAVLTYLLVHTIPAWERMHGELNGGTLSLILFLHLRRISVTRTGMLGGSIGGWISIGVAVSLDPGVWLVMLVPLSWTLTFLGLHATTVIGHPPRSILRRAADRAKEMVAAKPRIAWNPHLS